MSTSNRTPIPAAPTPRARSWPAVLTCAIAAALHAAAIPAVAVLTDSNAAVVGWLLAPTAVTLGLLPSARSSLVRRALRRTTVVVVLAHVTYPVFALPVTAVAVGWMLHRFWVVER